MAQLSDIRLELRVLMQKLASLHDEIVDADGHLLAAFGYFVQAEVELNQVRLNALKHSTEHNEILEVLRRRGGTMAYSDLITILKAPASAIADLEERGELKIFSGSRGLCLQLNNS